jgi:hypothetical protein
MAKIGQLEFTKPVSCYNGCYDSETQRVMDEQERVLKLIQQQEPFAHVTYFPMEEMYMVHCFGRQLGAPCSTRGSAILNAYRRITHTGE